MRSNIYGIQKVEETNVRSNRDVAMSSTGAMSQGSEAGSEIAGSGGAMVGAVVGLGVGLYANKQAKKEEKRLRTAQQGYNKFVGSMAGRAARSQQVVGPQAKKGMVSKGRYQVAEIEGAGAGKVGEIHTDKNFNIKTVANGAPKHENGGVTVSVKEGDIIFPTQGKDKDYRSVMRDIKRYKMGDSKAGKRLRARRDKLPKDSDYEFEDGGVVDVQGNSDDPKPFIPYADQSRNETFGFDPETYSEESPLNPNNKLEAQAKESNLDPAKVKEFVDENKNLIREVNKKGNYKKLETRLKAYDIDPKQFQDHLDKTVGGGSNITGAAGIGPKVSEATSKLVNMYEEGDATLADSTAGPLDAFSSPDTVPKKPPLDEEEPTGFKGTGLDPSAVLNQTDADISALFDSDTPMRINTIDTEDEDSPIKDAITSAIKDKVGRDSRGNPLKRANIFANLALGTSPAEQVTRRNFLPEEAKYRDLSHNARQANVENRNFQTRRGERQTSRSTSLGTNAQVNAQYMRQAQEINEREAGRQYQTDMGNLGLRNQAKETNFNMAHRYDEQDAQNRAAKQKFLSQAAAETATLAQYDEQRGYMMDLDAKKLAQDKESMQYVGSKYFTYDEDGNKVYGGPGSPKRTKQRQYDFNTELGINPDGSVNKKKTATRLK